MDSAERRSAGQWLNAAGRAVQPAHATTTPSTLASLHNAAQWLAEEWLDATGSAVQPALAAAIDAAHSCPRCSQLSTLVADVQRAISVAESCPNCGVDLQPIVEVAYDNSMWWSLPAEISYDLFHASRRGDEACYTWDSRSYKIDFERMEQENTQNGRRRSIRLLWVEPIDVEAEWTGQLPAKKRKKKGKR